MQPWLDCLHIPTEFLVDALVRLRDYFVGIVHEAAAEAGDPCSQAAAAFTPAVHTFPVEWNFGVIVIDFR